MTMRMGRRWRAPEVVQTSAMDCGPASLKCLLEGHGIPVSYDRLREACQTDVDGTSIDTLEEVAVELGLSAEQVLVPRDHLEDRQAGLVPALAVTRLPSGITHFVVIWRRHGNRFQLMDPGTGRRMVRSAALLEELYEHAMVVPAEDWRAWAGSEEFIGPLTRRLRSLGLSRGRCAARIETATADPTWRGLATLDAAARMVHRLRQAEVIPGRKAANLLEHLVDDAASTDFGDDCPIPPQYWSAYPSSAEDEVVIRGAVLVKVRGRHDAPADERDAAELSPELHAALEVRSVPPLRALGALLRRDGLSTPGVLVAMALLAGAGVLLEALMFRAVLDLVRDLASVRQRLWGVGAFLLFLLLLLGLELPSIHGWIRAGRRLELRLRETFLRKLPRIKDRYFHSRLASDMAERAHAVHRVRALPVFGGQALAIALTLVFTLLGILWLDPATWPFAVSLGLVSVGMPLWIQRRLREEDLKFRTQGGALARHYLDALIGLVSIRTHGAENTVWREHQTQLGEWIRTGLTVQRRAVVLTGLQTAIAFALAAGLLYGHLARGGQIGAVLLLVYWALHMPVLGERLTQLLLQYPEQRNVTARLLEPLGAAGDEPQDHDEDPMAASAGERPGVAVDLQHVTVRAGGHVILEDIDCRLRPGEHVAVVGRSGAGKSSLAGLLLGLHTPAAGAIRVDRQALTPERLRGLRAETAWVDPTVALWNRSFVDNLTYGIGDAGTDGLGHAVGGAELQQLLEHLPKGLQTPLGEAGAFVSGGEGQRIRLGRAMLRSRARLVILDEPFRGLDRELRRSLLRRVRRLWPEATLVCITHDVRETLEFPRVLVLDGGRIVEQGVPTTLAEHQDSAFAELLRGEAQVQALWQAGHWRRFRLDGGRMGPG